jgi:hypothetical protein
VPSKAFGFFDTNPAGELRRVDADDLLRPWQGFANIWLMADMALVLGVAVLLGAIIAYHPASRRKAASLDELEHPKTFMMYAMIGAVIGVVVSAYPVMGPVIFGIGGLLRFRTNVGPAKDTGRVILAVIVGVSAGLKLMVMAVLATACGWLLIWVLERNNFGRLQVRSLTAETIPRAAEAYRQLLLRAGCRIVGERKRFTKGMVSFVFTAPANFDREKIERKVCESLPADERGLADWDAA